MGSSSAAVLDPRCGSVWLGDMPTGPLAPGPAERPLLCPVLSAHLGDSLAICVHSAHQLPTRALASPTLPSGLGAGPVVTGRPPVPWCPLAPSSWLSGGEDSGWLSLHPFPDTASQSS